jgi:hypothetical protein
VEEIIGTLKEAEKLSPGDDSVHVWVDGAG